MRRGELSTTSILNAVTPRLRGVPLGAVALLLLTALPYRMLQLQFLDLLYRLRSDALHYGNLLTAVVLVMVVSLIASLYGRAVFIKACRDTPERWRDLLRLEPRAFLSYVYVALILELCFVMFVFTIIGPPLIAILASIAAVLSAERAKPGLLLPVRALSPYLRSGNVLVGLSFVFGIGFLVAATNLAFLARFVLWATQSIPGFDAVKWNLVLTSNFPRVVLATLALALAILEPFWLAAVYIYGERVRSRQTGDDLRRRFLALTAADRQRTLVRASTAAAILMLIVASGVGAQTAIPLHSYIEELELIRDDLTARRIDAAKTRAESLQKTLWVNHPGGRFQPDSSLLAAVGEPSAATVQRLSVTIEALGALDQPSAPTRPDHQLLERLRSEEKVGELWRGGEIESPPANSPGPFVHMARIFRVSIEWLAEKLEWLFDLISKLWPKKRSGEEERDFLGVPVVVWLVTLLVVATVSLLAIYVLRRSRRRIAPVLSEEVLTSQRDADPLSRESNEWERYAQELASRGRIREAIRAWYHAVLVTLYRAGVLHYRKGRTNWEYVRAISPSADWRPQFISMTRQFEREWYGHRESDRESLDDCMSNAREILAAVQS